MHLTSQEEKIARLALDSAARSGEVASAANKLVCSWRHRKITVEQIAATESQIIYQDRIVREVVYQDRVVVAHQEAPTLLFCALGLMMSIVINVALLVDRIDSSLQPAIKRQTEQTRTVVFNSTPAAEEVRVVASLSEPQKVEINRALDGVKKAFFKVNSFTHRPHNGVLSE